MCNQALKTPTNVEQQNQHDKQGTNDYNKHRHLNLKLFQSQRNQYFSQLFQHDTQLPILPATLGCGLKVPTRHGSANFRHVDEPKCIRSDFRKNALPSERISAPSSIITSASELRLDLIDHRFNRVMCSEENDNIQGSHAE